MLTLSIPNDIYEQILQQAINEKPVESCGILAGRNGRVKKFYPMTNSDQSRYHYMMVPQEQFRVAKDIRLSGLKMLAVYHSHPETPARLSNEDVRLALTPNVVYVIVSLQNKEPVIKGFLINDHNIKQVPIQIEVDER
ncbi:MAG: M67 family metallopeptidase [Planctomycetota bacterium]|jgi:proteasome lid subunit RPN8/RPN11